MAVTTASGGGGGQRLQLRMQDMHVIVHVDCFVKTQCTGFFQQLAIFKGPCMTSLSLCFQNDFSANYNAYIYCNINYN
jgi:hypothetical protein